METTLKVKITGAEMEALFEKENKNIRVKFSKYLWDERDEDYNDENTYQYEILFRCSEGTTDKEVKEFIKSIKWTKPKMKAEFISQIYVFETVNKIEITNTKDFTIKELKIYLEKLQKIKPWKKVIVKAPDWHLYDDTIKERKDTTAWHFYFLENTMCAVHFDNLFLNFDLC